MTTSRRVSLPVLAFLASVTIVGCSDDMNAGSADNLLNSLSIAEPAYRRNDGSDSWPPPGLPPKATNPALTISNVTPYSLTVSWNAATDPDSPASSLKYQVYYSYENNLDSVSNVLANGTPIGPAQSKSTQLTVQNNVLMPGTKHYFNVLVEDDTGNRNLYKPASATTQWEMVVNAYGLDGGDVLDIGIDITPPYSEITQTILNGVPTLAAVGADKLIVMVNPGAAEDQATANAYADILGDLAAQHGISKVTLGVMGHKIMTNAFPDQEYFNEERGYMENYMTPTGLRYNTQGEEDTIFWDMAYLILSTLGKAAVGCSEVHWDPEFVFHSYQGDPFFDDPSNLEYVGQQMEILAQKLKDDGVYWYLSHPHYVSGSSQWDQAVAWYDGMDDKPAFDFARLAVAGLAFDPQETVYLDKTSDNIGDFYDSRGVGRQRLNFGMSPFVQIGGAGWHMDHAWEYVKGHAGRIPSVGMLAGVAESYECGTKFDCLVEELATYWTPFGDAEKFPFPETTPPTPGNDGALWATDVSGCTLTMHWNKGTDNLTVPRDLKYRLYRSTNPSMDTIADVEAATYVGIKALDTSFNGLDYQVWDTDTKLVACLVPSTTYYFNVVIEDLLGNKAVYTKTSVTTGPQDEDPPDLQHWVQNGVNVTAPASTNDSVTLNFKRAADCPFSPTTLTYRACYALDATDMDTVDGIEARIAEGTAWGDDYASENDPLNERIVTGLLPNQEYFFNVIVKDQTGNKTAYVGVFKSTLP